MAIISNHLSLNLPEGGDIFNHDTFLRQNFQKIDDMLKPAAIEEFVATEGQTVFTTGHTYALANSEVSVEIDGVPQKLGSGFTETTTNSVTISEGVQAGTKVKVIFHGTLPAQDNRIDTLTSSLAENTKKLKKVDGIINVTEYGLIGDGISHPLSASYSTLVAAQVDYPAATALTDEKDWCAIQQAANIASTSGYMPGKGSTIVFPYCKAVINKQLIFKNVSLKADLQGTELHFQNFGNGTNEVSAVIFDYISGTQRWPTIENINFTGDGGFFSVGAKNTYLNGIEIINDAVVVFVNVVTKYFNKGHIWNNTGGHIMYSRSNIRENYYGIYCKQNRGDYRLVQTMVEKNNFANFATNASTGFTALVMRDGHCGFSPYAFYCEPEPSNALNGNQNLNLFLKDVQLDQVRFESIGNGAIYSNNTQGANPLVSELLIRNIGFNWGSSTYNLPTLPKDYAIDVGLVDGPGVKIDSGSWKFMPGNVNAIRVRQLNSSLSVIGNETANTIEVVSGTGIVQVGQTYTASRLDGMVVPNSLGGGFCKLVANNATTTYSPYFANNPNKRFKFFVMVDKPGDCFGSFFCDGTTIYPTGTIGSQIAYGATNPATASKLNIYVSSAGVIGVNNLIGSDRTVSISVEGFY